ncbi:MAG TPA: sugar phosphate nucleotidyltransferase [Dehalococcoidia bacterium]|nr:sugar phosphate nucleotidyltransferase [Dehalococcoidia bacterium]
MPELEHHYAIIMAGGSGTRLWPLARRRLPKQFIGLVSEVPLLAKAVARLEGVFPPERTIIITGRAYADRTRDLLTVLPPDHVLAEPTPRNTGPAVTFAALAVRDRDPAASFTVFPADHVILRRALFGDVLRAAARLAPDFDMVAIGIPARRYEGGYGYIEAGDPIPIDLPAIDSGTMTVRRAKSWIEKPGRELAPRLTDNPAMSWNSGIFTWTLDSFFAGLERHHPALLEQTSAAYRAIQSGEDPEGRLFAAIENVSIDKALVEPLGNGGRTAVIQADLGWTDVGDWAAVHDIAQKDAAGNAGSADHLALGSRNVLVKATTGRRVVTIDVSDLLIIDTGDVLLVCHKDSAQKVKDAVEHLDREGRIEVL